MLLDGQVSQYMPNFLWVLRDFALDLEDSNGHPISSSEYLERFAKRFFFFSLQIVIFLLGL